MRESITATTFVFLFVVGLAFAQTAGQPQTPPQTTQKPSPEVNLPEFEASSIREVAGTCPATPTRK
jgi:hypothetical protein